MTIDDDGNHRLEEGLADEQCPLNWLVPELAELLQVPVSKLVWERTPPSEGHNNARCASYRQRLLTPNGHPAIGAWVRLEAPGLSEWTTLYYSPRSFEVSDMGWFQTLRGGGSRSPRRW